MDPRTWPSGVNRSHSCHTAGRGPVGGHTGSKLMVRDSRLSQNGYGRTQVRRRLGEVIRPRNVGRDRLVVLEAWTFGGAPHHRIKDRPSRLGDFDSLGRSGPPFSSGLDPDVDRLEPRNSEVVARERSRQRAGCWHRRRHGGRRRRRSPPSVPRSPSPGSVSPDSARPRASRPPCPCRDLPSLHAGRSSFANAIAGGDRGLFVSYTRLCGPLR